MTRTASREEIIKILYQITILDNIKSSYDINTIINETTSNPNEFIITSTNEIIDNKKDIEDIANKYLKNKWTLNRLAIPDQGIILLGIYELLYTDTPNRVVIDEAINLSKKYSDDDIPKLINGLLDSVYHSEEKRK